MSRPTGPVLNETLNGAATKYTTPIEGPHLAKFSWQYIWTLTLAATITVQVSDVPVPAEATDADWLTYPTDDPITSPAGVAGADGIEVLDASPWRWWRLKIVWSGGAGNIKVYQSSGVR